MGVPCYVAQSWIFWATLAMAGKAPWSGFLEWMLMTTKPILSNSYVTGSAYVAHCFLSLSHFVDAFYRHWCEAEFW